jgi:hypothetical protein
LVGLAIGAGVTIFLRLSGIPLWTVAVIPVALVLATMTVYHWIDGLHHFTEHMRHRHRVHELEQEVTRLRAHLDQVLEMPGKTTGKEGKPSLPSAELAPEPEREPELQPEPVMAGFDAPTRLRSAKPTSPRGGEELAPEPPAEPQVEEARPVARKSKRPKITIDAAPEPHPNGADSEAAVTAQEA